MAKFCKKCGSPVTPEMKFCKKCGAAVQNPGSNEPSRVENTTGNSGGSKKIAAIILVIVLLAGAGGAAYYFTNKDANVTAVSDEDKSETKDSADKTEKTSDEKKDETAKKDENKETQSTENKTETSAKKTGALDAEDLKLGELSIGDSKEKVLKVLGKPFQRQEVQRKVTMKFDKMEVTLNSNDLVTGLVSNFSEVATPRGIKEGDPEKEVFAAYGTNYKESTYENLRLYEYDINYVRNIKCILRFAVRMSDHRVEYISIRVAD